MEEAAALVEEARKRAKFDVMDVLAAAGAHHRDAMTRSARM
ncbi:hypothetical protein SVIOM342S_02860 [Streptomyces violaceorubidus]